MLCTSGIPVLRTGRLLRFSFSGAAGIEADGKIGILILGAHRDKKGMHSMAINTPVQA